MTRSKNKVIILGSGTSTGVPIPGCSCSVCLSPSKKNKRLRTSICLQTKQGKYILIDTTPDLRTQLLTNNITKVDATIITHDHADHVHGIDDLRPLSFFSPKHNIPLFTTDFTAQSLKERFPYIFRPDNRPIIGGGIPRLGLHHLTVGKSMFIEDEEFFFQLVPHGYTQTLCFIHQGLGYITDCQSIPKVVLNIFKKAKLELLIIDCLRKEQRPKSTHLNLDQALNYIEHMAPRKAGLIHISHDLEHQTFARELKKSYGNQVFPLYDGQILSY